MAGAGGFDPKQLEGINEINITPFVDVVLVLLVIFIVTAPMMMKDIIGIHLPKTVSSEAQSFSTLSLTVTSAGQFWLNGKLQSNDSLVRLCREAAQKNPDVQAVISADRLAVHGDVVKAIDLIRTSGITQFAIQVEKENP